MNGGGVIGGTVGSLVFSEASILGIFLVGLSSVGMGMAGQRMMGHSFVDYGVTLPWHIDWRPHGCRKPWGSIVKQLWMEVFERWERYGV